MTNAEQNQKPLELIGDRRMTFRQMAEEGGCLIINGCERMLRGRIDKLVSSGALRKRKVKNDRKALGSHQFGPRPCEFEYEVVKHG